MLPVSAGSAYDGPMNPRLRKLVGMIGILVFLAAYVAGVATLGDRVPKQWAAQLAFYGLAGVLWGAPILPLITWMSRGR